MLKRHSKTAPSHVDKSPRENSRFKLVYLAYLLLLIIVVMLLAAALAPVGAMNI